jgi:hypothetical protein
MATTCKLISKQILSSTAASVTFSSIPGTYTDLYLVLSARATGSYDATPWVTAELHFNNNTTGYSARTLFGTGSATGSDTNAAAFLMPDSDSTANTFGNCDIYIPNYAGSTNKTASGTSVTENNGTSAAMWAHALLWSNTAAITEMRVRPFTGGGNFASGSSFFLYGITKA